MKYLFLTALLMLSAPVLAQTGIFYDSLYRGEGITVFEGADLSGDTVRTVYLYTYGAEVCATVTTRSVVNVEVTATATAECPNSILPPYNPLCDPVVVTETVTQAVPTQNFDETCTLNGQRWFVGSDLVLKNGDSFGKMYTATGMDFPNCVPSDQPFEEDVLDCADVTEVGNYILRPDGKGGYEMWIESDDDDPAFNKRYTFDINLLLEAEPK